MNECYEKRAGLFKALSDPNRLMILEMLSGGELCACKILERFQITQPTLSHHMKILCDCGLVSGRKEGKWIYYSLDGEAVRGLKDFLQTATTSKEKCISKEEISGECC